MLFPTTLVGSLGSGRSGHRLRARSLERRSQTSLLQQGKRL